MVRKKEESEECARAAAEAERALAVASRERRGSSRGRPGSSSVSWAPGTAPPSREGGGRRFARQSGGAAAGRSSPTNTDSHVIAVRPRSGPGRGHTAEDDGALAVVAGARVARPPGTGWTHDRASLAASLAYKHAEMHAMERARQKLPWLKALDKVLKMPGRAGPSGKKGRATFNLPVPGWWGEATPERGWSLDPELRAKVLAKKRRRLGVGHPPVPKHLDEDDAAEARQRRQGENQTLDWACRGFTEVTNRQLIELKGKTSLDLSHNPLGFLPVALGSFGASTLRHLTLHDCNFDDVGLPMSLFTGLSRLEVLDLSANLLTFLGPAFGDMTSLKTLVAHSNYLTRVDDQLGRLTKLVHLELQHNQLTALPPGLIRLKSLTYCDAEHNHIDFLPVFFGRGQRGSKSTTNLRSLKRLSLADNHLLHLPLGFAGLGSCESLWLQRNYLHDLPPDLGDMGSLVTLSCFGNMIQDLPGSFGKLSNLQTCALNDNHLGPLLPESLPGCTALVSLDLSDNEITSLPQAMGDLGNLKHLWLCRNRLESLPDSLGSGCVSLETLLLHDNKLGALPGNCAGLASLRTLTLAVNRLVKLPPTFRCLSSLERLSLDHNATFKVEDMPGDVFTHLESLDALSLDSLLLDGFEEAPRAWLHAHVRELKVVKSVMSKAKMASKLFGNAASTGKSQEVLKV